MSTDNPENPTEARVLRVFVSYSWDDEGHKEWVLAFTKRLRDDGIDAILDQTHLSLGARSPQFMEQSVRESARVLVICTEKYKERFDNRQGGVGYEGHIITGEIINEVGSNKFIPVLKNGAWRNAVPTALSGVTGVDLRKESPDEYRRLLQELHGGTRVPPIGPRPSWLDGGSGLHDGKSVERLDLQSDLNAFLEQRKKLPETDLLNRIWAKPHWHIWIRPSEFKRARFQSVEQCRLFILNSEVRLQGWFAYPSFAVQTLEAGSEWIAGEVEHSDRTVSRAERWALFRSGQFVQNRSFDEIPQLGNRVHVLEILDTTTSAFEFAARMAERRVLSPEAVIQFELRGIDGRELTWPQDVLGDRDAVPRNCWCQDEALGVSRQVIIDELRIRRRELALDVASEIYSEFGWSDPPIERLAGEQNKRFG